MSALRPGQIGRTGRARAPLSRLSFSFDRFVLPRWLRRPVRLLSRMGNGEVNAPPYAATIMSAVFLASSSLYGGYLGGHLDSFVQAVTARTGFAVDQIKVVGNRETSEIDVLDKLDLNGWTSLVGFDAEAARERIATLPWVQDVAVRKVYPHTLEVRLDERTPFAIWQQGSQLSVIERSGNRIAPYSGGRQALLPLIVGYGAPEHAPDLLAKLDKYPQLASRVRGYIRVGERRWDIKLDNGVTVKLPESNEAEAIADLVKIDAEQGILSRNIVAVDMRLADRLVVQLTPEAATERAAALKEKPKAIKRKPEARI